MYKISRKLILNNARSLDFAHSCQLMRASTLRRERLSFSGQLELSLKSRQALKISISLKKNILFDVLKGIN